MPTVYDLADTYRASLLQRDTASSLRLAQAYQPIETMLTAGLAEIGERIRQEVAAGRVPSKSWLRQEARYIELLAQLKAETDRFAVTTVAAVEATQKDAVTLAQQQAQTLTRAAATDTGSTVAFRSSWNRLPTEAVQNLIGYLGDGSPLNTALTTLGTDVSSAVGAELLAGVALGRNPRVTAAKVRQVSGVSLTKARTLARTETLRSYRQALIGSYAENSDIVSGWRWIAALSFRTCPLCVSMHGTTHPVTEQFGSHVNCRCTALPVLIGEETEAFKTGAEWFAEQSEFAQATILGKAAAEAYQAGHVSLANFVGKRHNGQWGTERFVLSLDDALKATP